MPNTDTANKPPEIKSDPINRRTEDRKTRRALLFYVKRRPKMNDDAIPLEWLKPADEKGFDKLIHESDFISERFLQENDLRERLSDTLRRDLQDLKDLLLEPFFRASQRSKHYQNTYYRLQWVLVIGSFVTALVGTLTVALGISRDTISTQAAQQGMTNLASISIAILGVPISLAQIAGILTAVVGAVTTYYTAKDRRVNPQRRWYASRRTAEELRSHYFLYLAHLAPYDTDQRSDVLEEMVVKIENAENP